MGQISENIIRRMKKERKKEVIYLLIKIVWGAREKRVRTTNRIIQSNFVRDDGKKTSKETRFREI